VDAVAQLGGSGASNSPHSQDVGVKKSEMPWCKSRLPETGKGRKSRLRQIEGRTRRGAIRRDGKQTERTSEVATVAWQLVLSHLEAPKKACQILPTYQTILMIAIDRKNNTSHGYSGFGSGSGSRAERVKNEDGSYGGSGHQSTRGGGGGGGGGGSFTKREDGGLVSSDEEEEENTLPRKDIDRLEISSDEFGDKSSQRTRMGQLPVRAARKEHQERRVGYNTDASIGTVAKTEQAESTAQPPDTTPKLKSESKDVAVTKHDSQDFGVAAKTEGSSDDESMSDARPAGLPHAPVQSAKKQDPQPQGVEHRPKPKGKGPAEPAFQTEDDRAEWERIQLHRRRIVAEFGPAETPEVDGSGDAVMGDAASTEKNPTVRDNNVYLFQIPPLMPEVESSIKKEAPEPKADAKIKLEEGGFSNLSVKPTSVRFGSGRVGKLRVHKSGRTTLDWGGTSFKVTDVGAGSGSHQEVVSLEITSENQRSAPEDAGDAFSLGQVKGKFVVTPDLDAIFK